MFLHDLAASLHAHRTRPAFHIEGASHTYADLIAAITRIRVHVRNVAAENERVIGIVANNDLDTYASIIACWFEGRAYMPLAPGTPVERNNQVIAGSGVLTLLASATTELLVPGGKVHRTDALHRSAHEDLNIPTASESDLAYLLFTSGTTGQPKGVPITLGNLGGFLRANVALGAVPEAGDRCLQMFELTFDLSVVSYLLPLLHGACVYTVPKDSIKYAAIAEIIEDHAITHALMVPSIINFMRPYLPEVNAGSLRYSLFCGEALHADLAAAWAACASNATIMNVYGPTEHTIYCTHTTYQRGGPNKEHHGVWSIGRAMQGSLLVVRDENGGLHERDAEGELCLSGLQLTPGYWNDPQRTAEAFFHAERSGHEVRFYRTGDLCRIDADGDILYMGRLDQQVKVQGYRVELAEIEHYAQQFLNGPRAVALAVVNATGNTEIGLVVETDGEVATLELTGHLRHRLPAYMVPTLIKRVPAFPLNVNGKTDRKALHRQVFTS